MPNPRELVVRTDLDGVWNRPEVGADAFAHMYNGFIAGMIGLKYANWERIQRDAAQIVRSQPDKHGWIVDGQIVTPWWADQYQELKAFAQEGLRIVRDEHIKTRGKVPTEEETPGFLGEAFNAAHHSIIAPPKPGARKAMKAIMKITKNFGIITNSETENAHKGLLQIFRGEEELVNQIRLIADAKKQKVNNNFDVVTVNGREIAIPMTLDIKGTTRKPLLRREQFIQTLVNEGTDLYIEDIAEYLYPPLIIGLQTILLKNKRTRSYEANYIANHKSRRGFVARSLDEIVERVEKVDRQMRKM